MSQPYQWTPDRVEELKQLATLLDRASLLNSGSHVVEKILLCVELANLLRNSDINTPRKSFLQFLSALAAEDRKLELRCAELVEANAQLAAELSNFKEV